MASDDSLLLKSGRKKKTDWAIWSLAYCQADMPYDFFGGAGIFSNRGIVRIPMIYTLLVGGEVGGKRHVALVDCGFSNDEWLQRYAFSNWESPTEVLGRVGFAPEDVDTILATHMHFDHVGNYAAFPNAKLYVQLDEYLGWVQAMELAHEMGEHQNCSCDWVFSSFDPKDLVRAAQGASEGRVRFLQGDVEVLPGVTAKLAKDSHTFGTQWFMVDTKNGPYAIAGDTVYWYSNVEQMWPPGYNQGNPWNQLRTYIRMRNELKEETSRIIPGHDPQIWERHPSWTVREINQIGEINLGANEASRRPTKTKKKK